jgi:hypothetical protein
LPGWSTDTSASRSAARGRRPFPGSRTARSGTAPTCGRCLAISSEYLIGLYHRACEHADRVIDELDLDAPARVAHWPEARRDTTLGFLLVRMAAETAHHAGHADIVRELIDGRGGPDQDILDTASWRDYVARVQAAAETFRPAG